jgi:hypothetical protein
MHRYFLEDMSYTHLLKDAIFTWYRNLMAFVSTVTFKIPSLCFDKYMKRPFSWSWNIQNHQSLASN